MDAGFAIGSIVRLQLSRVCMANGWVLEEFGSKSARLAPSIRNPSSSDRLWRIVSLPRKVVNWVLTTAAVALFLQSARAAGKVVLPCEIR